MALNRSEKLSMKTIDFLKNFKRNRIKTDTDPLPLSYNKLMDIIVNYFKLNNDRYLELVQMEYTK